jgi:hypothetical protein
MRVAAAIWQYLRLKVRINPTNLTSDIARLLGDKAKSRLLQLVPGSGHAYSTTPGRLNALQTNISIPKSIFGPVASIPSCNGLYLRTWRCSLDEYCASAVR